MQITVCDICGSQDRVVPEYFAYDRRPDGAGGMEDVGETYDLCIQHRYEVLRHAFKVFIAKGWQVKNARHEFNSVMIDWIEKQIKKRG